MLDFTAPTYSILQAIPYSECLWLSEGCFITCWGSSWTPLPGLWGKVLSGWTGPSDCTIKGSSEHFGA